MLVVCCLPCCRGRCHHSATRRSCTPALLSRASWLSLETWPRGPSSCLIPTRSVKYLSAVPGWHASVHVSAGTSTCIHLCTGSGTGMYMDTHAHRYIHLHRCAHTHTHLYMHKHSNTYMHVHSHALTDVRTHHMPALMCMHSLPLFLSLTRA